MWQRSVDVWLTNVPRRKTWLSFHFHVFLYYYYIFYIIHTFLRLYFFKLHTLIHNVCTYKYYIYLEISSFNNKYMSAIKSHVLPKCNHNVILWSSRQYFLKKWEETYMINGKWSNVYITLCFCIFLYFWFFFF